MATNYVSVGLSTIKYSGGTKQLRCVKTITPKLEQSATKVKPMVPENRPTGYQFDMPDVGLSLECYKQRPTPEIDWVELMISKEVFQFSIDEKSGRRIEYLDCVITSVSPKYDSDGTYMETVEIMALDRKSGPAAA